MSILLFSLGVSVRIHKGKVGSAKVRSCCDKSHWKQSGNQDPSWKRPDGIPGMPPGFWVKVYFAFFSFVNSYYNFSFYANLWQTLGTDPWQTTASSFYYLLFICISFASRLSYLLSLFIGAVSGTLCTCHPCRVFFVFFSF